MGRSFYTNFSYQLLMLFSTPNIKTSTKHNNLTKIKLDFILLTEIGEFLMKLSKYSKTISYLMRCTQNLGSLKMD